MCDTDWYSEKQTRCFVPPELWATQCPQSHRALRRIQRWWRKASGFSAGYLLVKPNERGANDVPPPPILIRQTQVCQGRCPRCPARFARRAPTACVCNSLPASAIVRYIEDHRAPREVFWLMASDTLLPRTRMQISQYLSNRLS